MCRIEPLGKHQIPLMLPLLQSYGYQPYRAYASEFGPMAISKLYVARMKERLPSDDTWAFYAFVGEEIQGLVVWSKLVEESQQLGFSAARIDSLIATGDYNYQREIKQGLLEELLSQCTVEGIRHLSVRIDAADLSSIHSLEEQGFIMVDGLLTYSRDLRESPWPSPTETDYEIRFVRPSDVPKVRAIARSAFTYGRLHADPSIPKAVADELHATWLEKSCSSQSGDVVLVAVDGDDTLGYSVHKVDHTVEACLGEPIGIWVIAGTAEQARRRGVARSLCYAMLDWQRGHGARIVEGGTQLANIASARLHESCGFRIVGSSVSMRKWLEQPSEA